MKLALEYSPFTRRTDTSVRRYIEARGLLRRGERAVVGVSGGPDSTAAVIILARLSQSLGIQIVAAHFDHRLRTRDEAAEDRAFVSGLCKALDVELACGSGDVRRRARSNKETLEEAARHLRYRFLGRMAKTVNATRVVVGHTLDDRAETVLMHIVRGSGTEGLAAMPARSEWPFGKGPDIARPLIELRREDTVRYCRESGIEPRCDPTNDLPVATRNRVRSELAPLLRTFNPRIDEALARLAESVATDADALAVAADREWVRLGRWDSGSVRFDRSDFAALPAGIAARLVRRAAQELGGDSPSARQIEGVLKGARATQKKFDLPGRLLVVVDRRWVTVRKR